MSITVYGAKALKPQLAGVIRDIRVTWLLEELQLKYDRIVLDPAKGENKTDEYLKINPTGKVPTLVDDGFAIFESAAICEYLGEKYGRFWPKTGSKENFLAKQWNYFVMTNLEPQALRIFAADYFYEQNDTTAVIRKLAVDLIPRFLKPLDVRLGQQNYLLSDELSVSDVLLVTSLNYIKHTPLLTDYPNLTAYMKRATERPAYQKAARANG